MTIKNQIVQVIGDDWVGIFVNGKLEGEGHSIPFSELMEIITSKAATGIDYFTTLDADQDWLEENVGFPETLREVVFHANQITPACLIWGD